MLFPPGKGKLPFVLNGNGVFIPKFPMFSSKENMSINEYIHSLIQSERFGKLVAGRFVIAANPGELVTPKTLSNHLRSMLQRLGTPALYSHQQEALDSIRQGRHTVVATPTASGKSLIYNLSLFDFLEQNAQTRALYLFPLKALAQDQLAALRRWCDAAAPLAASAAVYDGDTSAYRRKKIRMEPPTVIMTNPDMIHLSILPYHRQWSGFLSNLKMIVIDEVHTYRGLLGSHMAQVLRRLHRICAYYGADPVCVLTSATVAEPGRLARQLTGKQVQAVLRNGAGQGRKHIIILDPDTSPASSAILLLKAAMARNLRTIVYTKSRRQAELITLWARSRSGNVARKISVYRAGLLPEERRDIENKLKQGMLLAVISTSALELGIDIGDLDLCILVGYPGSMMATLQRSGRVGRKGQDSALIMIAGEDGLDQYFVGCPEAFRDGVPEQAVVNPHNETVLTGHLTCAAAELPFEKDDPWIAEPKVAAVVAQLEQSGYVLRSADGSRLFSLRKRPHRSVHLRGTGRSYTIVDSQRQEMIGEVDAFRVYRDTHPGAIYLHKTQTYLVEKIDDPAHCVYARAASVDFYTRIRSESDVSIIKIDDQKYINNTKICFGKLEVVEQVVGFERLRTANGTVINREDLELPPVVYRTDGIWFQITDADCRSLAAKGYDLPGTLHAAEHAAISMMPLVLLADRNDIGGLATAFHPGTGTAAVFIYDGIPGGAGLTAAAFEKAEDLLRHTVRGVERCGCENGCPACVHSPKCGNGNRPLDKYGAVFLIESILKPRKMARPIEQVDTQASQPGRTKKKKTRQRPIRYGVFDLETQHSASEVGGWHRADRMKISCGVVYDAASDDYNVYMEPQAAALIEKLREFDLLVGFNSRRFDYLVLSGYSDFNFESLPTLDLLEKVHAALGFRLSLDHLAQQTLHVQKSGSGLDALEWWKAGDIERLVSYCRLDVRLTRDLYLFARRNGYLVYQDKSGRNLRIPLPDVDRIDS